MIKKSVGVIGCGKWGKIIIRELKKISNIKFIFRSKDNYKNYFKKIDWVFVLTPNETHYKIVKYFLKKKTNVFCEKPLTLDEAKAKELINISKKKGVKMYIDDIEKYKKKKLKISNFKNYILRTKKDKGSSLSLLNRLAYHDLYLLNDFILNKNIRKINTSINQKKLEFQIVLKNKLIFEFYYNIDSEYKIHKINNTRFDKFKNNPVKDMLLNVLDSKRKNFDINNLKAINCIKLINRIKKSI